MRKPSVILFDADGTLYDSERINYESSKTLARNLHDFELTWELYDTHMRRGSKSSVDVLTMHGHEVDYEEYHAQKHVIYTKIASEKLQTMPGLVEFLDWCEINKIRRIIVSAAGRKYIESSLEILGITKYFEGIISREDVMNKRKPLPFPYEQGLKLARISSNEVLAIEDTDKGINSAQAAGLRCVGILNEFNSLEELAGADYVIRTYDELIEKFQSSAQ